MDIEDNAEVLRQREALDLVLKGLGDLLQLFAGKIDVAVDQFEVTFHNIEAKTGALHIQGIGGAEKPAE